MDWQSHIFLFIIEFTILLNFFHSTQVVVGVHDSRSIFRLKKRVPIDNTERRMLNVKKYADMVNKIIKL